MKRLIFPIVMIALILGTFQISKAQTNPNDTMAVIDSYGLPGDSITIPLYMANRTVPVGAYVVRLVFNRNILEPIAASCIDRGCNLEFIQGYSPQDTVMVVVHYSMAGNFVSPGAGNVALMSFRVRPSATPGSTTTLRFVDHYPDYVNSWADTGRTPSLIYPVFRDGNFSVTGGPGNQAPVIINVGPQQVREGQTLQFAVTAHDPNGDHITLSGQNLPANASFPTVQGDSVVTGTFTFSPDFTQGPDTFYVGFLAQDDHNNTTTMTVMIVVLEQPDDILSVDSNQGGVPGAIGRALAVKLYNSRPIYGVQFNYTYDESQITVSDVVPTERCANMGFWFNSPDPGRIVVLIFSPGLDAIAAGDGPLVNFITDVSILASFGNTPVVLDSAIEVIDSSAVSRDLRVESGHFSVDRFGDANLDGNVNVGDCVKMVGFIIQRYDLSVREMDAADMNRDARVNVADLQLAIDYILQMTTPPLAPPSGPVATVELIKDQIPSGDQILVPMWADIGVPAAAVQYEVRYNAQHLQAINVETGEMVSGMQTDHNLTAGKINGVVYNLGGQTFGPSAGEMANFAFRVIDSGFDPLHDIYINEFLIVDQGAGFIPTEIKGRIPTSYALNQNYPNPFNSSTTISFDLPNDSNVELSIYDILGRKVTTLLNSFLTAGSHTVIWNGQSESGETMATGVFFYRLRSADFDETKKMTLVK